MLRVTRPFTAHLHCARARQKTALSRARRSASRQSITWLLAAALVVFSAVSAHAQDGASDDERYQLVYKGELIDQDQLPISGVFPLVFKLYPSAKGGKAMWTEALFVSVLDGAYTITLGRRVLLPEKAIGDSVYLAVLLDGAEVVRQPIIATVVREGLRAAMGGSTTHAEYADRAGDAETVGGYVPEEFANAEIEKIFERHLHDKKLHGGGGGGSVLGNQNWKSDYAGGSGGKTYSLSCPEGFVATGIEGRSGAVLDSIRVVCTKLE